MFLWFLLLLFFITLCFIFIFFQYLNKVNHQSNSNSNKTNAAALKYKSCDVKKKKKQENNMKLKSKKVLLWGKEKCLLCLHSENILLHFIQRILPSLSLCCFTFFFRHHSSIFLAIFYLSLINLPVRLSSDTSWFSIRFLQRFLCESETDRASSSGLEMIQRSIPMQDFSSASIHDELALVFPSGFCSSVSPCSTRLINFLKNIFFEEMKSKHMFLIDFMFNG